MDKTDAYEMVRAEIIENFQTLSDKEKEIIRTNKGTEYTNVIRKVIPREVLAGLSSGEPKNISVRRRGLAAR